MESSSTSDGDLQNIIVRVPYGSDYELEVPRTILVSGVIARVLPKVGSAAGDADANAYHLVTSGRLLMSDKTLAEQNVSEDAVLLLIRRNHRDLSVQSGEIGTGVTDLQNAVTESSARHREDVDNAHHSTSAGQPRLHHFRLASNLSDRSVPQNTLPDPSSISQDTAPSPENERSQDSEREASRRQQSTSGRANDSRPHHPRHEARVMMSQVRIGSTDASAVPSFNETRNVLRALLTSLGFCNFAATEASDIAAAVVRSSHYAEQSSNLPRESFNIRDETTRRRADTPEEVNLEDGAENGPMEGQGGDTSVRASLVPDHAIDPALAFSRNDGIVNVLVAPMDVGDRAFGNLAQGQIPEPIRQEIGRALGNAGLFSGLTHANQTSAHSAGASQSSNQEPMIGSNGSEQPEGERSALSSADPTGEPVETPLQQSNLSHRLELSDQGVSDHRLVTEHNRVQLALITMAAWKDAVRAERIATLPIAQNVRLPENPSDDMLDDSRNSLSLLLPAVIKAMSETVRDYPSTRVYSQLHGEPERDQHMLRHFARHLGALAAALTTSTALLTTHIQRARAQSSEDAGGNREAFHNGESPAAPATHSSDGAALNPSGESEGSVRSRTSALARIQETGASTSVNGPRVVGESSPSGSDTMESPAVGSPSPALYAQYAEFMNDLFQCLVSVCGTRDSLQSQDSQDASQIMQRFPASIFRLSNEDLALRQLFAVALRSLTPADFARFYGGDMMVLSRVRWPVLQYALDSGIFRGHSRNDLECALQTAMGSLPDTEMQRMRDVAEAQSRFVIAEHAFSLESRLSAIIHSLVVDVGALWIDSDIPDDNFVVTLASLFDECLGRFMFELSCMLQNGIDDACHVLRAYLTGFTASVTSDDHAHLLSSSVACSVDHCRHAYERHMCRTTNASPASPHSAADNLLPIEEPHEESCVAGTLSNSRSHQSAIPGSATGSSFGTRAAESTVGCHSRAECSVDGLESRKCPCSTGDQQCEHENSVAVLDEVDENAIIEDLLRDDGMNGDSRGSPQPCILDSDLDEIVEDIASEVSKPRAGAARSTSSRLQGASRLSAFGRAPNLTNRHSFVAPARSLSQSQRSLAAHSSPQASALRDGLDGLLGMREAARVRAILQRDSERISERDGRSKQNAACDANRALPGILSGDLSASISAREVRVSALQNGMSEARAERMSREASTEEMGQLLLTELESMLQARLKRVPGFNSSDFPFAAKRFQV